MVSLILLLTLLISEIKKYSTATNGLFSTILALSFNCFLGLSNNPGTRRDLHRRRGSVRTRQNRKVHVGLSTVWGHSGHRYGEKAMPFRGTDNVILSFFKLRT
jgi:hypothetical protein